MHGSSCPIVDQNPDQNSSAACWEVCITFNYDARCITVYSTREMYHAISKALRSTKPVPMYSALRIEITHWLFLETWDDPLPWRDEKHFQLAIATDASASGWGGMLLSCPNLPASDYWTEQEQSYDIATKEAVAVNKVLLSFSDTLRNTWVDAKVDNQAVVHAWHNQRGRSPSLNNAIKALFFTTVHLNIALHLAYIPTDINPADAPSRRLSSLDSRLHPSLWAAVQQEFGGPQGHTCDFMSLDSNAMTDLQGIPSNIFLHTPHPIHTEKTCSHRIYLWLSLSWNSHMSIPLLSWLAQYYVF